MGTIVNIKIDTFYIYCGQNMDTINEDLVTVILTNLNYHDTIQFYSTDKKYHSMKNNTGCYKFSIINDIINQMKIILSETTEDKQALFANIIKQMKSILFETKEDKQALYEIYNERYAHFSTVLLNMEDKDFFLFIRIHISGLLKVKNKLKNLPLNVFSTKYKWILYITESTVIQHVSCNNDETYQLCLNMKNKHMLDGNVDIKNIIAVMPYRKSESDIHVDNKNKYSISVISEISTNKIQISNNEENIKNKFYKIIKNTFGNNMKDDYVLKLIKIYLFDFNVDEQITLYELSKRIYKNNQDIDGDIQYKYIIMLACNLCTDSIHFSVV